MKKITALTLACLVLFSTIFVSCKKKETNNNSSDLSSVTYLDASSSIAKTETDGSFTFAFDPYVLPADVKKAIGGSLYYNKFVSAIINREESVSIPSREIYDNIRFALGENFPFTALVEGYRYNSAEKEILISYNFEKTHEQKIEEFKSAVQAVFDSCVMNNDDNTLAAMLIYKWLSENIAITENKFSVDDLSGEEETTSSSVAQTETSEEKVENVDTDILSTLINKEGTAESVAALYDFLLLQLGIECKTVSAWTDGTSYYTWNMIQLDSKWYHCDIYKEQKSTEGAGLKFFGMTQDKVSEYVNSSEFFTGEWTWFSNEIPKANSNRFEDFSDVVSWEVSAARTQIEAYTEEFSRFVWEIK